MVGKRHGAPKNLNVGDPFVPVLPSAGPAEDLTPIEQTARLLDALYATLPALKCQGKCQRSCGPILMGRVEWERMKAAGGERHATTLTCPYLEHGRCSVYAVRPAICRLWGTVEQMKCPWGCIPERYLTDPEGEKFLHASLMLQPPMGDYIALMPVVEDPGEEA